jgi:voltage-gated potassium channel
VANREIGVRMPVPPPGAPLLGIARRFALALLLVLVNWGLVILERDSYHDSADGTVSVVDALYYTTVTLSTTGYGDITPVTTGARLINALVVTPMRLLFVVILVGTTINALTERSREDFRRSRWRSRVKDHVVVCGYGAKGRNAARALLPKERVVVVDIDQRALAEAAEAGFVTVDGPATRPDVLAEALVARASTVIIALNRDDTSVLVTLAARRLAPHATIVVTASEAQNGTLLRQSGATSVIITSETAGRLLGMAAESPDTVAVVEDLLSFGEGLDLDEVGRSPIELVPPVLAVLRDGRRHYAEDDGVGRLRAGDRLVLVRSQDA